LAIFNPAARKLFRTDFLPVKALNHQLLLTRLGVDLWRAD